ncbi:hypothetical protein NQD34_008923 [Periophthalmus magnuspinnatus]|nr:hypothetical protein NQD34_008923 [Periophthalmus magnuspinnatus]
MARFGSRTIVEEINPDSRESPKETHRSYILGGDTLGGHTIRHSVLDNWEQLDASLPYITQFPPSVQTRSESTWTRSEPTWTRSEPTRTRTEPTRTRTEPTRTRTEPTRTRTEPTRTRTEPTRTRLQPRERPPCSEQVSVEAGGVIPRTRAVSVRTVLLQTQAPYRENIRNVVRHQCPELRRFMNRRFPGESFQLALKKVNFKKVQQTFSEVFRLRKLIRLGESVCVLYIGDICQGSGFVLTGNLILTNAHLLSEGLSHDGRTLTVPVKAVFNYENTPVENDSLLICEVYSEVLDLNWKMDYAILYLNTHKKVPPGLLLHFGPKPDDGGACIIGHPGGQVKKIDLTFIIGKNERQEAANQQLEPLDNSERMVIVKKAEEQNIENIWCSDLVITYNTSNMYHGSSGSPLFDDECRVVGLHTAGFTYGFKGENRSIIEYAHPVLDIFTTFVQSLGSKNRRDFLEELEQSSSSNPHLREIFQGLV